MAGTAFSSLLLWCLMGSSWAREFYTICDQNNTKNIYDIRVPRLVDDDEKPSKPYDTLGQYIATRFALVVNVATFCGFTDQYPQLNALTNRLDRKRFKVLAVPCNQFGHQEPAANRSELLNGLKHVRPGSGFLPHFDLLMPSDVNGQNELELYTYLKERCPAPGHTTYFRAESFWDPIRPTDVSWNFEKFLVDSRGVPLLRFSPDVEPNDLLGIINDIIKGATANVGRKLAELDQRVATRAAMRESGKKRSH